MQDVAPPSSLMILTVTLPAGPPPISVTDTVMVTASPTLDGFGTWLRICTSNAPVGKVGVTVGVDVAVKVGEDVGVFEGVDVEVGVRVAVGVKVFVGVGVFVGVLTGVEVGTELGIGKLNASTSLPPRPQVLPSK